jgi:integrase
LEEVANMMEKLPELARTVCAVAAFTGLTRSEIRGFKWDDYNSDTISVRRKVVDNLVGPTKTDAREGGVFVTPILKKIRYVQKRIPEAWRGMDVPGRKASATSGP